MKKIEIISAINKEIKSQEEKWGHVEKDVPGWILVAEAEMNEAKHGWVKQTKGKHSTKNELIQTATAIFQCLMKHY